MVAKSKTSGPEIDDDALYSVTVIRRIEITRNLTLRRGSTATIKGKILKEIRDHVTDIQPIAG